MTFEAKLNIFEGPLDLLLHLVKKNEVDISDIPIATITDQYLEYIDLLKALDINVAGEFLVMASTLMYIKSKMLLPKNEDDELDDIEDPMEEIVRPLMEYMQLKEASHDLSSRHILNRDVFKRGVEFNEKSGTEHIATSDVNLYELIDAFKRIIKEKYPNIVLKFRTESWSVKEKADDIMERLKIEKKLYFKDLFITGNTIPEMVAIFLALLNLVKDGFVKFFQDKPGGDIRLEALNTNA